MGMDMAKSTAVSMTIRIEEVTKSALLIACEREHRSQANMIEFLIIDYCRRNEIPYPPAGTNSHPTKTA